MRCFGKFSIISFPVGLLLMIMCLPGIIFLYSPPKKHGENDGWIHLVFDDNETFVATLYFGLWCNAPSAHKYN